MNRNKSNIWDKTTEVEENGYYWHKEPVYRKGNIKAGIKKPTVIELFSGCGGTSFGFQMAGYHTLLGCDIHAPSIETFKRNHPDSYTILGDIKKIMPESIKELIKNRPLDVLIAGVPCQGFSLNNRKRSYADKRNLLYKEFVRFIKILKPRAILLENVSGMKSTGDFVKKIESELSSAGQMKVTSKLLFAPDYGVPQKRTRLVFAGIKDKEFNFDSVTKTHGPTTKKEYINIKQAIGDLPSLTPNSQKKEYEMKPFCEYQRLMRKKVKGNLLLNHRAPNHPPETIAKIKNTQPGFPLYEKYKQRIRLSWDIQSPTQVCGGIRPQFQFGHPSDARGLTLRERCRIQSFPDHFEVCGGIVQGRVQTGNAVPPLLAKALAMAIKKYL